MAENVIRIEIPIEAKDETASGVASAKKSLDNLSKTASSVGKSVGNSFNTASGHVSKFDETAQKTQSRLQKWMSEKYKLAIEARDKVTPALKLIKSGITGLTSKAHRITMSVIDKATSPIKGIINTLKNPVLQGMSILGITLGVKDTIDTYKDFESTMSNVKAISGASETEFSQLTAKAEEMGAKTKFTAKEAGDALTYMAMAGWKTKDMLNGIEGIMDLAAASGEDLGEVSDIVTDALTAFGMSAKESGHFADILAAASSSSNTNVAMMGETFKYAASMAGSLGYKAEDVALAIGLMANSGIKASMAGTALNTMFTRIATDAGATKKSLGALGVLTKRLGVQFYDSKGNAVPFINVLEGMRKSMKGLSDQQKSNYAKVIAGTEAQKGLLAIINASEADFNKLKDAIDNCDGAAESMAETNRDNLKGSLKLLQSALDGVKIEAGKRIAPYIREFADWLTEKMPEIQEAVGEFFDWFDQKATDFKNKLHEITSSTAFKDADFFGKVKILWDGIIADPFEEWWDTKGKKRIATKAEEIGNSIGRAINSGIMTLLGIDVSGVVDDGTDVGRKFAQGFSEGFDFDSIKSKLLTGVGNIFQSAAKLIPGGKSADIGSLISAGLIAKFGIPLLTGTISAGKDIYHVGKGSYGLGKVVLGSSATGKGLLGLGANTAISLGAGNLAGGASLSAGALSALGLGSIAGGAVGIGTAISGGMDAYKAFQARKSGNQEESELYKKTATRKLATVGSSAMAGALIGSAIPGLGTAVGALVGAGIGGATSLIASRKEQKEYEQKREEEQKAAEEAQLKISKMYQATGRYISDARLETKSLKAAIDDTSVSADEFAAKYNEVVQQKIQNSFGNIKMSLKEIQATAKNIIYGNSTEKVDNFATAVSSASDALTAYQSDLKSLQKQNWSTTMEINAKGGKYKIESTEAYDYRSQIDQFTENAQTYLADKQYEMTQSMTLMFGSGVKLNGLNKAYENLKKELQSKIDDLNSSEKIALSDNILTIPEQENIQNLESQISDILAKVTANEQQSSLQALQIKYGGADLDYSSFQQLQQELQSNLEEMSGNYDNELKVNLENLNFKFNGDSSSDQYQKEYEKIVSRYRDQIDTLNNKSLNFQIETLAGSGLGDSLKKAYGTNDIDELVSSINTDMRKAIGKNSDASTWTADEVSRWFGLGSLSAESQTAIEQIIQSIAETIPESVAKKISDTESAKETMKLNGPVRSLSESQQSAFDASKSSTKGAESSGTSQGDAYINSINSQLSGRSGEIRTSAENATKSALSDPISQTVTLDLKTNVRLGNLPAQVEQEIDSQLSNIGISKTVGTASGSSGSETLSGKLTQSAIVPSTKFTTSVKHHASGGISSGMQLSWINEEGPEAIIPLVPQRRSRALDLYQEVGDILGITKHAEGTVPGLVHKGGATPSTASGSTFGYGHTPDIASSPSYRKNTFGFGPTTHDSVTDINSYTGYTTSSPDDYNEQIRAFQNDRDTIPVSVDESSTENRSVQTGSPVSVNVQVSPTFQISGTGAISEETLVAAIKRHMAEISDEMGGAIALRLQKVYENMPSSV